MIVLVFLSSIMCDCKRILDVAYKCYLIPGLMQDCYLIPGLMQDCYLILGLMLCVEVETLWCACVNSVFV